MHSRVLIALTVLLQGCDSRGSAEVPRLDGGASTTGGGAGIGASSGGSSVTGAGGVSGVGGSPGSGGVFGSEPGGASGAASLDGGRAPPDATVPPPPDAIDGPAAQAFNERTGRLEVDYPAFFSKHDVVYRKPNADPLLGLTVGNGRTGAMVWDESGVTMQISGVDTSEQTAFSAGLVTFQTSPPLGPGARDFSERLSLYDGTLTTTYEAGRTVTILGAPGSEVLGIHIEDPRPGVSGVSFEIGIWDLRVFPAMPTGQSFLGRFTLLAKGGFLVSSEKEGADIKYIGLKSVLGGTAHLANPWGSASVQVRDTADGSIVTSSASTTLDVRTTPGAVYVVERTSKPLSSYTPAHIGGTSNSGTKHLEGTTCALGM